MTQDKNHQDPNEDPQPTDLNQDELDDVAGGMRNGSNKPLPPPLGGSVTPAVVWNSDEPPSTFWPHKKHP